ncbi:MAG: sigma-70 family RNA polymerase sigma factor [Spirochaetaceae bacterium]|nr:sigma-70 family RNA polymerase sigma factor [Spirochaetaceae bacterium]
MRVHESVVLGAKLGERIDFERIVRSYEAPLYGYALSGLGEGEAEDAVQEIFLKAYLGLKGLRDCGRFEAWLYAIARNELRSRRRARSAGGEFVDIDLESLGAPASASFDEDDLAEVARLLPRLSPEQASVLRLRYWTDLSLREIALVEDIPEKLAKSRLWEALERLRKEGSRGGRLSSGTTAPRRPETPPGFEERMMDKLEIHRNAGAVFERLGLAEQVAIAVAARKGERWDEGVLAALGKTNGGAAFVRAFDARLKLRELAEIVNCCDRFTEKRLVEELERLDPGTAEAVKEQMFVFEDFSLFDASALTLLFDEVDLGILALGLAGIERRVRELILGRLPAARRAEAEAAIARCDPAPERVRAAQEEAIAWTYAADKAGRFVCGDRSLAAKGEPFFSAAPR